MKFSNFTKLLAIVFLMISFFSTKTLADYEKVFFDFSVELVNGKLIDLKEYKNKKAILLVNTASYCGFTKQYNDCLLYTSPSPRDAQLSRMPSSA